jgi:DNA ligase (NAD+)
MKELINNLNLYSEQEMDNYVNSEDLKRLHSLKLCCDNIYFNEDTKKSDTYLNDNLYDILKTTITIRDKDYTPPIGVAVNIKENKVKLPIWLGSMNKLKETGKIEKWLKLNKSEEFEIHKKIDGVSCLLVIKKSGCMKIYTRGNGKIGTDISYFLPYFKSIPKNIKEDITIRGELVMYDKIFNKKFSGEYANARNFVSGRVNGKIVRDGINDIKFIAYELILNKKLQLKPSKQLKYLHDLKFLTVGRITVNEISIKSLSKKLITFKNISKYQIDGLVIQPNKEYTRNSKGNPKYAFAFKMTLSNNLEKAEVVKVIWNVSKWGKLKPKLQIKPINLNGSTINFTTGFNAKYIYDNNIDKGTTFYLTKSGDVIPYIVEIIKSSYKPSIPDIPCKWNKSKVDLLSIHHDKICSIKLCSSFFSKLSIKHVGEKTLEKMFDFLMNDNTSEFSVEDDEDDEMNIPENYLLFLSKVISADKETLLKVPGFKELSVNRIMKNIKTGLKTVSLSLFLGASGVFGFGMAEKKIELLLEAFPTIFKEYKTMEKTEFYDKLINIKGFSDKSIKYISKNINIAGKFIEMMSQYTDFTDVKKSSIIDCPLKNMKIVFSGFRDTQFALMLKSKGAKQMSSVSSNTSVLIVLDKNKEGGGKVKEALKFKVEILEKKEFVLKYIR